MDTNSFFFSAKLLRYRLGHDERRLEGLEDQHEGQFRWRRQQSKTPVLTLLS